MEVDEVRKMLALSVAALCAISIMGGCGGNDLLCEMKEEVPVFEGAEILKSYMPTDKMSVIQLEVEASKATQHDILSFYEKTMTKKGWGFVGVEDYGADGSVMELIKKDRGTLSIQTITKKTKETGIIQVVLSLEIE